MEDVDLYLYGAPASLYTAKVRAFLRARGVAYAERFPSHPRYREVIRPAADSHRIPVVEFADGEIVQDSALILDALERRFADPAAAAMGPRQRTVTALLELACDRGLAKPAMHYRWSFPETNEAFIVGEFGRSLRFPAAPAEVERLGRRVADKMSSYLPMLGITPRSIPAIEAAYAEHLALLDKHFATHPYVLGGAPSRGDYALMGPLYGHLGRDPRPLQLMQRTAPLVFRWTERVNGGERQTPEFPDRAHELLPDDGIPETLAEWLRLLFADYAEELLAGVELFGSWAAAHADLPPGALVSAEGADQPALGPITVNYRGVAVEQQALAHPLWLLQRAQDVVAGMNGEARAAAQDAATAVGAGEVLAARLPRRLTRIRNRLAVE